jgi:hypothetical protein
MGDTITKTRFFVFLSLICLVINLIVCGVAYLKNEQDISTYFATSHDVNMSGVVPPNNNVTIANFGYATGSSFVPFISIINLAFLGLDLITNAIIVIILGVIGALQLFCLVTIALNMLPFFNA